MFIIQELLYLCLRASSIMLIPHLLSSSSMQAEGEGNRSINHNHRIYLPTSSQVHATINQKTEYNSYHDKI